jgi:hypothetical protein
MPQTTRLPWPEGGQKTSKIRWRQIWTVSWMFRDFTLQFPEGLQRAGRNMGTSSESSSSFRSNCRIQPSLKHVAIGCTCDNCYTFQVGLKNRPLRIPDDSKYELACRWLRWWISLQQEMTDASTTFSTPWFPVDDGEHPPPSPQKKAFDNPTDMPWITIPPNFLVS